MIFVHPTWLLDYHFQNIKMLSKCQNVITSRKGVGGFKGEGGCMINLKIYEKIFFLCFVSIKVQWLSNKFVVVT